MAQWLKICLECRRHRRCKLDPWVGKISWRKKWQPTLGCFPGKFQGQRSLVDYSLWGCKKSDMTVHTRKTMQHTTVEKSIIPRLSLAEHYTVSGALGPSVNLCHLIYKRPAGILPQSLSVFKVVIG